jgi:hypothetical protein
MGEKLSANLQPIYDLEIRLGNAVVGIGEPAGSDCPLAIMFQRPLHRAEIESTLSLSPAVKWWENHDSHYSIEGGYQCAETRHTVAGPLP